MQPRKARVLLVFIALLFFGVASNVGLKAQTSLSASLTSSMDNLFYQSLLPVKGKAARIVVFPFTDQSLSGTTDPLLGKAALIEIAHNLLVTGLDVVHPLAVLGQKWAPSASASITEVASLAANSQADYAVTGFFQYQKNEGLRFFLNVINVKEAKQVGPPGEFVTAASDLFFHSAQEMALFVSQAISNKKQNKKISLSVEKQGISDWDAFRYFVRGYEHSTSYNPGELDIAQTWMEKALLRAPQMSRANEEMQRISLMKTVYSLSGQVVTEVPSSFVLEGISTKPIKNKKLDPALAMMQSFNNRWRWGLFYWRESYLHLQAKETGLADQALSKALVFLPELKAINGSAQNSPVPQPATHSIPLDAKSNVLDEKKPTAAEPAKTNDPKVKK